MQRLVCFGFQKSYFVFAYKLYRFGSIAEIQYSSLMQGLLNIVIHLGQEALVLECSTKFKFSDKNFSFLAKQWIFLTRIRIF